MTEFALQHLRKPAHRGTPGTPEFRAWFEGLGATAGDHLIFRALDGQAKLHGVEFQPRAARDEAAIAERNRPIVEVALKHLRGRLYGAAIWETAAHLLSTGQYRHPIPPDPLAEIWTEEVWGPELARKESRGGWGRAREPEPGPDPQLSALFGAAIQVYDFENPQDLPREYDPDQGRRRPGASPKANKGPVKSFIFRVSQRNHRSTE